jgi:hypothetical protein
MLTIFTGEVSGKTEIPQLHPKLRIRHGDAVLGAKPR